MFPVSIPFEARWYYPTEGCRRGVSIIISVGATIKPINKEITMGRGLTSKTGKYESIVEFFDKNAKKGESDLENMFLKEYPGRDFNHYKSRYFSEYDLGKTRTSKCDKQCWTEADFNAHVAGELEDQGYTLVKAKGMRDSSGELRLHPDIVAEKSGTTYYFEVKGCYHQHRIQTGIGQLFYYEFLNKGKQNCKYVLVFPEESQNAPDFNDGFIEIAEKKLNIEVRFL